MTAPNILLVTVDSLRADHVGGPQARTPAFDSLATDGVSFGQAFAQGPFTTFSMPSLFTSRYPSQLTAIDFVEGIEGVIVDNVPTIQERLRDAGYITAGIHSNPLLSRLFGFDEGFDHFDDGLDELTTRLPGRLGLLANKIGRLFRRTAYVPATDITDKAIEWLRHTDDEPFFLWVHYMDAHGPYHPESGFGYLEKFRSEWLWQKAVRSPAAITSDEHELLREAYRDEVERTDDEFGRLLEYLKNSELYEESVVVLTSDHGDEFGEHGSYSHEGKLYDELIHVPLVIKGARKESGLEPGEPVPLLDVGATLVVAGGGRVRGLEGISLFEKGDESDRTSGADGEPSVSIIISEARLRPRYVGAVRSVGWKYIETPDGRELYNLRDDPEEKSNVVEENPGISSEYQSLLESHREYCDGSRRSDAEVLDSGELDDQLRSLGYLE